MKAVLIPAAGLILAGALCAQTEWTNKAGNPVVTLPEGSDYYGPSVAVKAGKYHMFLTRKSGSTEVTDHLASDDGLAWGARDTVVLKASGDAARFDQKKVGQPAIVVSGDTLKMWYWGAGPGVGSIGYAWSLDGKAWTKVDGPNSNKSVYDVSGDGGAATAIASPSVIKDGAGYKMWYARLTVAGANIMYSIGHATSPDGMAWTHVAGARTGGAVLERYADGSFDSVGVYFPSVVKDGDVYKMWYSGQGEDGGIGYATSADGISWTRVPAAALKGAVLAGLTCSVMKRDGGYYMWYMGDKGVNVATSGVVVALRQPSRAWPGLIVPIRHADALGKRHPVRPSARNVIFGIR
jgi:hypothetical protein